MTENIPSHPSGIDYSIFLNDASDSWEQIYNKNIKFSENLQNIIANSVFLPNARVQIPIITAYILIPSALGKILPILFCYGKQGTGKSTIGKIASKIHGVSIFNAETTFAAFKNATNQRRWDMSDEENPKEKNAICILDDIKEDFFREKPQFYSILKSGYDRNTDTMEIASNNAGQNLTFRTFCTKIIGSVSNLHCNPKFKELQRRLIIIRHKKFENLSFQDKKECYLLSHNLVRKNYDLFSDDKDVILETHELQALQKWDGSNRLDIDNFDWTGFDNFYKEFWQDINNCVCFAKIRKRLGKRKKDFELPKVFDSHNWIISIDLICAGITTGVWENLEEALKAVAIFWEWSNSKLETENSATLKLLNEFIQKEIAIINKLNSEIGDESIPYSINPLKLKNFLAECGSKGQLDMLPNTQNILDCMEQLGWRLDKRKWVLDK